MPEWDGGAGHGAFASVSFKKKAFTKTKGREGKQKQQAWKQNTMGDAQRHATCAEVESFCKNEEGKVAGAAC